MLKTFKKLDWFFKQEKKSYILAVIIVLLNYGFILIPPYMVGHLADRIMQEQIDLPYLYRAIGFLLIVIVAGYVASYFWSYYLFRGAARIGYRTRLRLMRKFLVQSPIFYENNSTGSLMGKSTNDVNALRDFAGFGVMAALDAVAYPIALIGVMLFTTSPVLTIVSVLPLPLLILFSRYVGRKLYAEFDKAQQMFDEMNDSVLENVSGVRVIRAYNREENEKRRFHERADNLYRQNMKVSVLNALFTPAVRIVPGISYIIALVIGAVLIGRGQLTIGQLISFTVYLSMMVWPMFALGEYINVSEMANASADRIREVMVYKEEVEHDPNRPVYPGGGAISFRDVSFSYPKAEQAALKEIRFHLPHGKTLGIVGKIGSGKSTLVKQLLHLYPIQEQGIFLGEKSLEEWQTKSVREKIGYVPQNHVLFSRTVAENIAFGKNGAAPDDILRAARSSDFLKDLAFLSEGMETMAGEKGIALSGGQKQRISIARAMIKEPEILILDDSLSAVDANTEAKILQNIRAERQGKTTLIVAHRLSAVLHADLILVMDAGRITESGTHAELYAKGGWYREQFDYQKLEGGHEQTA